MSGTDGAFSQLNNTNMRRTFCIQCRHWLHSSALVFIEEGHWEHKMKKQKNVIILFLHSEMWSTMALCGLDAYKPLPIALPWLVMAPLSKPIPIYKLHEAFCLSFLYALLSALTFLCYGVEYFKYRLLSVQTESVYRVSLLGSARPIPYQVS